MNRKITLNQLADSIAKSTGSNSLTAKTFIQDLTDVIAEALSKGKSVTIKGLGTFSVSDDIDPSVIWHPDESLAENINQPFEAFEPVELEEGVTEEILEGGGPQEATSPEMPVQDLQQEEQEVQEIDAETTQPAETTGIETPETPGNETDETPDSIMEMPEEVPDSTEHSEPEECEEQHGEEEPRRRYALNPWIMLITGLLAGFIIGYFSAPYIARLLPSYGSVQIPPTAPEESGGIYPDSISASELDDTESATAESDTVSQNKATEPVTAPPVEVSDTVTQRRYLTTMARKYYGDYRFWVYIYLENSDIITNPNRIKPGTAVVIPPAEKYGIDASDPESVAEANEKIRAILEKLDK